jgi:hypothetical protein
MAPRGNVEFAKRSVLAFFRDSRIVVEVIAFIRF